MAAASGITTSFKGLSTSFSSKASLSQTQLLFKPFNRKSLVSQKRLSLTPKCAAIGSRSSSLDLLKTSSANRYTKERSSIVVIGLNIHTTPLEIFEKLAIPEAQWSQAICELCALNHIEEAAVLNTCNRIEIYVVALSQHRGVKEVTEWMSEISGVPVSKLCQHRFLLYKKDAVQHLFEVAAGLDSLALGECQILDQVRQVVTVGQEDVGFGKKIKGLFNHAIRAGAEVRKKANIASGPVSVSSAAVELAITQLPKSSYASANILVIGAGKMGKLVIKHLIAKGCKNLVVVNRSEEEVIAISKELNHVEIIYQPLSEMLACANEADAVFTCVNSQTPLFLKDDVHMLRPVGSEIRRRLFIDISVPGNVESCVSELDTAHVYNMDDVEDVVAANEVAQHLKVMKAQAIISEEVNNFEAFKDSLEASPTIRMLRAYVERIRASEVDKCLSKLGDNSKEIEEYIYDISKGIANMFFDPPIRHLRCNGNNNSCNKNEMRENVIAFNRVYDLETDIVLEQIRAKMEQRQK